MKRTFVLLLMALSAHAEEPRPWTSHEANQLTGRGADCYWYDIEDGDTVLWVKQILVGDAVRKGDGSTCFMERMKPIDADPPTGSRCDAMRDWVDYLALDADPDYRTRIETEMRRWCEPK